MKVILKQEVDNLGLAGDVVDVADGYGRNFLVPRGIAILATPGAMKEAQALTRSRKGKEAKTIGSADAYKVALEARSLRIPVRVDEFGNLYGSVTATDVQRVLKERGHDIERRRITITTVKVIGEYTAEVQVHPQVSASVLVEVVDADGKVLSSSKKAERDAQYAAAAAQAADEIAASSAAGEGSSLEGQALDAAAAVEDAEAAADAATEVADEAPADA